MFLVALLRGHSSQCLPKGSKAELNPLLTPQVHSEPNTEVRPPPLESQAPCCVLMFCPRHPDLRQVEVFPFVSVVFTLASSPAPFPEMFVSAC